MIHGGDFEIVDALYASGAALFYVMLLAAGVLLTVFLVRFLLVATKAAQLYVDRHSIDPDNRRSHP